MLESASQTSHRFLIVDYKNTGFRKCIQERSHMTKRSWIILAALVLVSGAGLLYGTRGDAQEPVSGVKEEPKVQVPDKVVYGIFFRQSAAFKAKADCGTTLRSHWSSRATPDRSIQPRRTIAFGCRAGATTTNFRTTSSITTTGTCRVSSAKTSTGLGTTGSRAPAGRKYTEQPTSSARGRRTTQLRPRR